MGESIPPPSNFFIDTDPVYRSKKATLGPDIRFIMEHVTLRKGVAASLEEKAFILNNPSSPLVERLITDGRLADPENEKAHLLFFGAVHEGDKTVPALKHIRQPDGAFVFTDVKDVPLHVWWNRNGLPVMKELFVKLFSEL